jgi:hypothetical protein
MMKRAIMTMTTKNGAEKKPTLYGAMRLRKLSTASVTDQPIVCLPDSRAASMSIIFSAPLSLANKQWADQ